MIDQLILLEQLAKRLHKPIDLGVGGLSSYRHLDIIIALSDNNGEAIKKHLSNEKFYANEMAVTQY